MWFHSVADSVNFSHKVKLWSPMVARMQILKYGSNQNRKKLSYIPDLELTSTRVLEPVIHGRGYKPRSATSNRKNKKRGQAQTGDEVEGIEQLVLDQLDDQALRKRKVSLDQADRYEK